jgi:hypothetical protein
MLLFFGKNNKLDDLAIGRLDDLAIWRFGDLANF